MALRMKTATSGVILMATENMPFIQQNTPRVAFYFLRNAGVLEEGQRE